MKVLVKFGKMYFDAQNVRRRQGEEVDLGPSVKKCPSWGVEVGTKDAADELETIRRSETERRPRAFKLNSMAKAARAAAAAQPS